MDLEQLLSSADFSKSTDLKERFWKEYVLEGKRRELPAAERQEPAKSAKDRSGPSR